MDDSKLSFQALQPALGIETLNAINALGFRQMTPVQASTIPLFLTNKDVCVEAVTGSGKTLAFVIPVIEMILRRETPLKKHQIGAIIISPTRELAKQIFGIVDHFTSYTSLKKPLLLVGGTNVGDDFQRFTQDGADILVATPGRLCDLLERYQSFDMKELEVLVLDEADTLLNMGFQPTLTTILSHLPKQRRTGLFSATQTKEVRALARAGLRNPATISVQVMNQETNSIQATPTKLSNFYLICHKAEEKLPLLIDFLQHEGRHQKIMIFFITCAAVDYFYQIFQHLPIMKKLGLRDKTSALHGKMVQKKREAMYGRFSSNRSSNNSSSSTKEGRILLCTDVAARGIDVPDVDWIIQYEPPQDPSFFVHRVGRTARAGKEGRSLTFLLESEDPYVEFLRLKHVPMAPFQRSTMDDRCNKPPSTPIITTDSLQQDEKEGKEKKYVLTTTTSSVEKTLHSLKNLCKSDRGILENGTKAFTAFIRAYKEHQCQFIFQFAKLDLAAVARSYGLLRLPKMPELAHHPIPVNFEEFNDTDTRNIAYKDKKREEARQRRLKLQLQEKKESEKRKDEEESRNSNKKKKETAQLAEQQQQRKRKKRKGRHQQIVEEWDELGREERLYKRFRQKKISKEEYERELRKKVDDSDSDNSSDFGSSDDD